MVQSKKIILGYSFEKKIKTISIKIDSDFLESL